MNPLPFQPTLLALPQVAAVLISAGFAVHVWRQHLGTTGAKELILTQVFTVIWALMGALEFCASTIEAKLVCSKLSYIGIVGAPWALLRFAWVYTGVQRPLPRWFYPVTLTWAAVILAGVFTNGSDGGLVWARIEPIEIRGEFFARYDRGPGFWLNIAYGYSLTLASCTLFLRHAVDLSGIYRGQSILSVLAIACPWLTSLAYILRIGPLPEIDNTPVGFAFGNVLFTWNLLRWHFLDLSPVATRTLFARMSEPVLVIDSRNRISQANRAATESFQLAPERHGQPLDQALAAHPALLAVCLADLSGRSASPEPVPDDNGRWWSVDSTPLASPRGLRYGRLCVLHDITALMEARRAAELAAHARAEFFSHVSHDLRTPLHSILVLAEVLRAGPVNAGQAAQLGTLREAGQSLLRLVNNLLDMNRLESGFIDLADTGFHVADVLLPVVELLRVSAARKGLELAHEIEPGWDGALRGDPDRLRQILFNLGGNAVKFTESGRVVLSARRVAPDLVRIEVSDTGPGLPPGRVAALFDPFVRAEAARRKEGTGLGLSIVRRLAEAMGGEAFAENRPEGGARFIVDLPILDSGKTAPATASAAPPLEPAPEAAAGSPAPRLPLGGTEPLRAENATRLALLVDDDPRGLEAGAALLACGGFAVKTAADGETALALLAGQTFAVIVLDGQLPDLDGIEVTRRLRASGRAHANHATPVLGFTADPSASRRHAWLAAGANAVLAKPADIATFTATLATVVAR